MRSGASQGIAHVRRAHRRRRLSSASNEPSAIVPRLTPQWPKKWRHVVFNKSGHWPRTLDSMVFYSRVMNSSRFNNTRANMVQAAARARRRTIRCRAQAGRLLRRGLELSLLRKDVHREIVQLGGRRLAGQATANCDADALGVGSPFFVERRDRPLPGQSRKMPDRWPA